MLGCLIVRAFDLSNSFWAYPGKSMSASSQQRLPMISKVASWKTMRIRQGRFTVATLTSADHSDGFRHADCNSGR